MQVKTNMPIFTDREGHSSSRNLAMYDFVLRMTTREISDAFVTKAIEESTPEDRETLARAVRRPYEAESAYRTAKALAGDLKRLIDGGHDKSALDACIKELDEYAEEVITSRRVRLPDDRLLEIRKLRDSLRAQTGGAVPPETINILAYRVLQLADAIHDFADGRYQDALRKRLAISLGVTDDGLPMMEIPITYRSSITRRRQLTLDDILNKSVFIEAMALNQNLTFGTQSVENPLWKMDFQKHIYDGKSDETAVPKYREFGNRTDGLKHQVEMFCYPSDDRPVLRLAELVDMRGVITKAYSVPGRKFVVDQNAVPGHPGDDRPLPFLVAWMLGFENTLASIKRFHKIEESVNWTTFGRPYYCDASIHDGATYGRCVASANRTGKVFHEESKVQVSFEGLRGDDGYGIVIEAQAPVSININDLSDRRPMIEYNVFFTENGVRRAFDVEKTVTTAFRTDKASMKDKIEDLEGDCSTPLALKLAGDWGQIEHCRSMGDAIFVTSDKLAALYALARNVPLMCVHHGDDAYTGQKGNLFLHYAFVMIDRRVDPPPFVPAPSPSRSAWGRARQVGGKRTLWAIDSILVAIIVIGSTLWLSQ